MPKRKCKDNNVVDSKGSNVVDSVARDGAHYMRKLSSRHLAKILYDDVPTLIEMIARHSSLPSYDLMHHLLCLPTKIRDFGPLNRFVHAQIDMVSNQKAGWSHDCIDACLGILTKHVDKNLVRFAFSDPHCGSLVYKWLYQSEKHLYLVVSLIDAFDNNDDMIHDMFRIVNPKMDDFQSLYVLARWKFLPLDHQEINSSLSRHLQHIKWYNRSQRCNRVLHRVLRCLPDSFLHHPNFFPKFIEHMHNENACGELVELFNAIICIRHEDLRLNIELYRALEKYWRFELEIFPVLQTIQSERYLISDTIFACLSDAVPVKPLRDMIVSYKWSLHLVP